MSENIYLCKRFLLTTVLMKESLMSKEVFDAETSYPPYLLAEEVLKFTLRITLRGIKPAIWRKIEVPSNISLRHLGDLTLDLMGWGGGHLNQFIKGGNYYLPRYQREAYGDDDYLDQEDYTIADLLPEKAQTATLEYDFGDGWEHELRLSSVDAYGDGETKEKVLLGGKRACPPEDCGGVWGYEDLLEILAKLKTGKRLSPSDRERLEWADWDKDYNPDFLDLENCREIVREYNK